MDNLTLAAEMPGSNSNVQDVFISLVIGLDKYLEDVYSSTIPPTLRHVLNALSLNLETQFPKTITAFLKLCEQPVGEWFPYALPVNFNPHTPLLYEGVLTEEAREYYFNVTERMKTSAQQQYQLPQAALDNLFMVNFLDNLKADPNRATAQACYAAVRSFLITYSWITTSDLRNSGLDPLLLDEIANFYEDAPFQIGAEFYSCDRCGILQLHNGRWRSIKPDYCHEHPLNAPYVHRERTPRNLRRLKRGIHVRTFLPGQAELRLFEWAEALHEQQPTILDTPERYPGLDAYDLRLTFSDGEVWAIDVKDHKSPYSLAPQIQPLYGEGDLTYNQAFYVIPDKRFEDDSAYRSDLKRKVGALPHTLHIDSETDFRDRVEAKVKHLLKESSRKRGKGSR